MSTSLTHHLIATLCLTAAAGRAEPLWTDYAGGSGPGQGRSIVLVSGDEEYRSEEALPQLGKILARHHGFRCRVLYAIDPKHDNIVNPAYLRNIPGLETLRSADLMIIATRFRALPDDQMQHIDDYLRSGRPVIGLRTANHGFRFPADSKWAHYGFRYHGPKQAWKDGFGQLVLGSYFFSHHGRHGHESTRGIIAPDAGRHPILRGITNGDIWGPTDVYGVNLPLPGDSQPLVLGQVLTGMRPDDPPVGPGPYRHAPSYVKNGDKNKPMIPVAWTKSYQLPDGKRGKAFATTMGAATDLTAQGTRRMLVNAVYWCLGMESALPPTGATVDTVGDFKPSPYRTHPASYWIQRKVRVSDFVMPTQGTAATLFNKTNLVAWCIVPFDAKKRGPDARVRMLKALGITKMAYDWRAEHVASFEAEVLACKRDGVEFFAFWGRHPTAFALFKKHGLTPQVWQTMPQPAAGNHEEQVADVGRQLLPLVNETREMRCSLGLYNHGGWAGEPANLTAVVLWLRANSDADHVGIVYNLHHAHNHIADFAKILQQMKPYLLCLNLNGMNTDANPKILPVGKGAHDARLLRLIIDSGYTGPIGIIDHRNDTDTEIALRANLDGLRAFGTDGPDRWRPQPIRPAAERPQAPTEGR